MTTGAGRGVPSEGGPGASTGGPPNGRSYPPPRPGAFGCPAPPWSALVPLRPVLFPRAQAPLNPGILRQMPSDHLRPPDPVRDHGRRASPAETGDLRPGLPRPAVRYDVG